MRSMVTIPDNKDLSNKEKEHTHTVQKKKKKTTVKKTMVKKSDGHVTIRGIIALLRVGKLGIGLDI